MEYSTSKELYSLFIYDDRNTPLINNVFFTITNK